MSTFLTADLHLGEDRLQILGRPFKDAKDNVFQLRENHNKLVDPEDTVIVVGDVCYLKTPEWLHYINQFNGKKILIRGNHDRVFRDDDLKLYFDKIIEDGGGMDIDVEGIPCYITHYPTQGKSDRFNLVGHIHTAWKYQLNMFNVGVDANHFFPVNLNRISFHLKAITEFYDQDVWCAYNGINTAYVGKRGKVGTYFHPENV